MTERLSTRSRLILTHCIQGPVMATQTLLRCHFKSELPLCFTAGTELLLCHTAKPSFSVELLHKPRSVGITARGSARACAGVVMGNWPATGTVFKPLSPLHLRVSMCIHTSHKQSPGFPVSSTGPQRTHGAIHCGRPQGWDIQHVVWITYSTEDLCLCNSLFHWESLPVAQVPTFFHSYLIVYEFSLQPWFYTGVILPVAS